MGFIFDGLDAEDYDRSYSDRELIRRIIDYFRPHTRTMATVVAMVVLGALAETVIPIVVSRGIDALSGSPTTQLIVALAGGALVLGSLGWLFNFIRQGYSARAVGDVVLTLREDAFAAVMQRDLSFYDQYASGKIVSRVTSDTQDFSSVVTLTIDLLSQLLLVLIIVAVLLVINWQLTLIALAIAPLVFIAALSFRHIARTTTRRAQRAIAQVNAAVQETIGGIAVAKSFRQEAAIYEDFRRTNARAYGIRLRQGLTFNTIFPVLDMLSGLGLAAVIYVGGRLAVAGTVSTGEWYLFVQSLAIFFFPLTSIASFWSQFQQGLSASERVFALIDATPRVVQTGAAVIPSLRGEIRFAQVDFSYDTADEPPKPDAERTEAAAVGMAGDVPPSSVVRRPSSLVLKDFSLHIPAGQKIAVVGHTGAGKSSLTRLITRFYEFQAGAILIDGHDIRALDLAAYRRRIGLVPQSPFLFSGTVAENIRYGRPDADTATVEAAAGRLGGGDWVEGLPHGLATDVGERGARLSLGQRQLVALARVLLQDPAIFILDEATASIDPFTEAQIQDGLDVVMRGRTSMIIAHRLSTVRSADRIIVMRAGRIIEEGNHDQLLAQGGHYAELYTTYFRHQSLEYIEQVGALGGG